MAEPLGSYVLLLLLGIALTVLVGQILIRTGESFLEEVFNDERTARSVNRLLAVLFHLVVLGVLALISTIEVPVEGVLQTLVTKLGVVLLVLGAAHGSTMLMLARIRSKRREQDLADEMSQQIENSRQQQGGHYDHYGQHVGAPHAHTPQSRPVIEAGPQQ
ncbi:MAG: hypothetical protein GEV09_23685 [Pseudonocardiaceae bacterium]|nr:hypothetical protein [Pseudonocardiaceae bacterium]